MIVTPIKDVASRAAVLGGAAVDQISPSGLSGIITPEVINDTIIFGLTFSAWVTLSLGLGAIIVAVGGLLRLYRDIRDTFVKRCGYDEDD